MVLDIIMEFFNNYFKFKLYYFEYYISKNKIRNFDELKKILYFLLQD
jgi:hypothetical protein